MYLPRCDPAAAAITPVASAAQCLPKDDHGSRRLLRPGAEARRARSTGASCAFHLARRSERSRTNSTASLNAGAYQWLVTPP